MCQALEEIMKDTLEAKRAEGMQQGMQQGIAQEKLSNKRSFLSSL